MDQSAEKVDAWNKDPGAFLYDLATRNPGENAKLELNGFRLFIVQDHADALAVFRNAEGKLGKFKGTQDHLFTLSRLTADDKDWRPLRDASQPFLSALDMEGLAKTAFRNFHRFDTELRAASDGGDGTVELEKMLDRVTLGTITEALYGVSLPEIDPDIAAHASKAGETLAFENWYEFSASDTDLTAFGKRKRQAYAKIIMCLLRAVRDERSEGTLLRDLYNAPKDRVNFLSEATTMMFAGYDTTATALCWLIWWLATHPADWQRVKQEVSRIKEKEPNEIEALFESAVLNSAVSEAFRCFPPSPLVTRFCKEDGRVGSLSFKKGDGIFVSVVGLHHDHDRYPEPGKFDIRRFEEVPANKLFTFGGGKRVCPGVRIARVEVLCGIYYLVSRCNMTSYDDQVQPVHLGSTMRRKAGFKVKLGID